MLQICTVGINSSTRSLSLALYNTQFFSAVLACKLVGYDWKKADKCRVIDIKLSLLESPITFPTDTSTKRGSDSDMCRDLWSLNSLLQMTD